MLPCIVQNLVSLDRKGLSICIQICICKNCEFTIQCLKLGAKIPIIDEGCSTKKNTNARGKLPVHVQCIIWGSYKKTMTTKLGARGDNGLHQGQERWTCSGLKQSWPMRPIWDCCYQVEIVFAIVMSTSCSQHLRNGPT
jgi:hypothetical protein